MLKLGEALSKSAAGVPIWSSAAAVLMEPESFGSHETTWKQAKLLMEKLETPPEDLIRVSQVFKHLGPKDAAPPHSV